MCHIDKENEIINSGENILPVLAKNMSLKKRDNSRTCYSETECLSQKVENMAIEFL